KDVRLTSFNAISKAFMQNLTCRGVNEAENQVPASELASVKTEVEPSRRNSMANPEHVAVFDQGIKAWNKWRKRHPEIQPDLSAAFLKGDTIGEEKVTEKGIEPCPNMCKHEQRRTSRKNARSVNWPRAITRQPIGSFMPKWSSRVGQERRLRRSQLNWITIPKRCVSTWHD